MGAKRHPKEARRDQKGTPSNNPSKMVGVPPLPSEFWVAPPKIDISIAALSLAKREYYSKTQGYSVTAGYNCGKYRVQDTLGQWERVRPPRRVGTPIAKLVSRTPPAAVLGNDHLTNEVLV